jgi:hypothetical protein
MDVAFDETGYQQPTAQVKFMGRRIVQTDAAVNQNPVINCQIKEFLTVLNRCVVE